MVMDIMAMDIIDNIKTIEIQLIKGIGIRSKCFMTILREKSRYKMRKYIGKIKNKEKNRTNKIRLKRIHILFCRLKKQSPKNSIIDKKMFVLFLLLLQISEILN